MARAWVNDPMHQYEFENDAGDYIGRVEVYPSIYCAVKESGEKRKCDRFQDAVRWLGAKPETEDDE